MAVYRERRWPWITAGYAVLFLVVAALTAFIYDSAAPYSRSDVIRFAVAFVVAVILIHLRSYFRGDPRWDPPSPFEEALVEQPAVPQLDSGFGKLREEVANSRASRSYFEKVLWPRLSALARTRGLAAELPLSAERRWLGRGPSGKTIAGLIDRIEGER
jgi:hypothetical protein